MMNIGRYEVIEELGRGGMATVYEAYDPQFDREVAVKVLPPEFLHDPTFAKRFNDEARTIARLEHRCILPVYDFGEANGSPYIVMRLMPNGSLSDDLRRGGAATFERVGQVVEQVANALDYAHSRNIVHRDLKPANLLLDDAGNVYLSDFGLAKLIRESQQAQGTLVAGTPAYMAPEQARGQMPTPRTDVYALGALAFELLAGKPPFEAPDILALMYMHAYEPLPRIANLRPGIPAGVQSVLQRAMAKEPNDRYASAGELAKTLADQLRKGKSTGARQSHSPVVPATSKTGPLNTFVLPGRLRAGMVWPALLGLAGLSACIALTLTLGSRLANLAYRQPTVTVSQTIMSGSSSTQLAGPFMVASGPTETSTILPTHPAPTQSLAEAAPTGTSSSTATATSTWTSTPTMTASATYTATATRAQRPVPTATVMSARTTVGQMTVSVQANQKWQDAGTSVRAGQVALIQYMSGSWTWSTVGEPDYFDGLGDPFSVNTAGHVCGPLPVDLPEARAGALIGKLANATFYIGDQLSYTVPQVVTSFQPLSLRMDDCDGGLQDNAGSIVVQVTVSQ